MPMRWARSAAVILITGSISSTSGAADGACAAPVPTSAEAALAGIERAPDGRVRYREEIRHPILPEPEIARGTLSALPGGLFVKDQVFPEREISEVGDRFIKVRQSPGAPPNLLPISEEMAPILALMGGLLTGNPDPALAAFDTEMIEVPEGWLLRLSDASGAPGLELRLAGCGARLARIEIAESGDVERRYILGEF